MTEPKDWKANRAKWVAALRETDRTQARGLLQDTKGQCCLGVLCEVAGLREVREEAGLYSYGGETTLPPAAALAFVGLFDAQGTYGDGTRSLALDNDSGTSFAQIAGFVESEPDGLFQ